MNIKLLTSSLALILAACQTTAPSFVSMSEQELFTYNQEQPLMEKVWCTTDSDTSSYIRKRRCMTVADWVDYNARSVDKLEVLNSAGSNSLPGVILNDGPQR